MQYLNLEGKTIPSDSRSNDLWFQHMAIVVSDINRAYAHLQSFPIEPISVSPQTIPLVSSGTIKFTDSSRPYRQGCLVKDPNGHAMLLIVE